MRAKSLVKQSMWGLLSIVAGIGVFSGSIQAAEIKADAAVSPLPVASHQLPAVAVPAAATASSLAVTQLAASTQTPAAQMLRPVAVVAAADLESDGSAVTAETPPQHSASDVLLLIIVGVALIAYQLLRKHRLLRPQPFSL